jgi:5'-nucleotidase
MKTILIVNDDGIASPGLKAAAKAVKDLGRVVIVAPAMQQSGVGRSISLFSPVGISKGRGSIEAYSIAGTPADAVIIGIYGILKAKPDLLVSGINIGENMSSEATTSGTVGAALEGASQGVPAIAISLHTGREFKPDEGDKLDFSLGITLLRRLAGHVLSNGLPAGVDLLNVNVPAKVRKPRVKITRLARRMYTTRVQERTDPRGRTYYWIDGDAIYDAEEDTDVHAVRIENCVSITPLKLDLTCMESLEDMKKLEDFLRF